MSDWSSSQAYVCKARAGFSLPLPFWREGHPEKRCFSQGGADTEGCRFREQLLRSAARHGIGHEQEVE